MTRRILSTALVSAAAVAALLGMPANADDPTPTATASPVATMVETVVTPTATEAPTEAPTVEESTPAPTEAPTEVPTETPAATETPTPETTQTPAPTATETQTAAPTAPAATETATATATPEERKKRSKKDANRSSAKNGQARACEANTKKSTSTSASGCVKADDGDHAGHAHTVSSAAPTPRLTNDNGSPAPSNPSFSLATPGPAKIGVPNFFIDKFRIPPFLLPIYQAAGMQYGIRWEILAGINEIETDYGRNLNVSSAGALGWMQFMPATWKAYGVDANRDGVKDPFNPVDAIFAAARYLKAAGAETDIRKAVFAYNHADWYVDSVLMRAQVIGGIPGDLVGSLTGLTQGRFPVRAKATYAGALKEADSHVKGSNAAVTVESDETRRNIEIFAKAGSPVIAVNDGKVLKIGSSERLGKYVIVQDVYGNTYTYGHLKTVAATYPSPKKRTAKKDEGEDAKRRTTFEHESKADAKAPAKSEPDTTVEAAPTAKVRLFANPTRKHARAAGGDVQVSAEDGGELASDSAPLGLNPKDFVAKPLVKGARVLGGTTLGRIGQVNEKAPHLLFEIRPAGRGAPRIDPKPILDGWKLLESTEVYRAKGKNALFGKDAGEMSIGEIMLMSKENLIRRVLADNRIEVYGCGRGDIRSGAIDRRVMATLLYLANSGLKPTVSSLKCGHGYLTASGNVSEHSTGTAMDIAAINGITITPGTQGKGSITDLTITRLLNLQGTMKPHQIISLMTFKGADNTIAMGDHGDHIHVGWRPLYGTNEKAAKQIDAILKPQQWIKLIDRLGEIDNPTVAEQPSKYAVKVKRASH
ncbi:lytic murein transglycosylase [Solirubrobacter sp. CPCC 204708]|uniref:Lytic murein transglycosylase n=1 Tax=Solirubrobacter deserti TaxID=2282478 RepID=A0ABT4RG66_9ACTN|nr:lytic murein transglycosylase [Solirubrobacter deserti]MBE2319709.1 lytic murein transglycosylase [Solirubrobacter deserti]MDA0137551.1 lytic murein transglycosylase [Solirubrobacter deserti]